MVRRSHYVLLAALVGAGLSGTANAQQVNIRTPQNNSGGSFYESVGVNWGFNIPGGPGRGRPGSSVFFNSGSLGGATPAFGGFDPNAAARGGFGINGPNGSAFFNFSAGQGSSRSIVSQAPSVTIPNGGTGYFMDGTIVPFVVGVVPVVGAYSPVGAYAAAQPQSVIAERIARLQQGEQPSPAPEPAAAPAAPLPPREASSAEQGDLSVAEIRRQRAAQSAGEMERRQDELAELMARARNAEESGKRAVAGIYYRQAARHAEGELKEQLLSKSESLRSR